VGEADDPRGSLATAVWMTTGVYCAGLAALAMLTSLIVQILTDAETSAAIVGTAIWGIVFIGSAAVVGWVVGAIVGVPLGLVVGVAHGRLRTRAVSILLPLVALLITTGVVYGWLGTRSRSALAVAVFLTLLGGVVIAGRYEHLVRSRPLH
jgi:hypothetical protein